MSWIEITEVLGNLGDFIGSVAVLATLIYLAGQMRAIRKQTERDHLSAEAEVFVSQAKALASDPELRRILLKASAVLNPEEPIPGFSVFEQQLREGGLSDDEVVATDAYYQSLYLGHLNAARTAPNPKLAAVITRNFATNILAQPLIALWWQSIGNYVVNNEVHRDFAVAVNQAIDELKKSEDGQRDV